MTDCINVIVPILKKQMTILSESESLLTDRLTGDEKKMFLTFVNASDIILGESELDSFIVGFRLGARLSPCRDFPGKLTE